jgi:hypothetical protein
VQDKYLCYNVTFLFRELQCIMYTTIYRVGFVKEFGG